jgi:aminoglycoside phosphotransferase (APT) family kinase protein
VSLAARRYSQRLGVLTGDQLQRALDRFDLGKLVSAEPAPGGLFGQNVFVSSTAGEFVLRGCPHYDWQLAHEARFAELLHERTRAPVPWPYRVEESAEIFGWGFAILPRMPGLAVAQPDVRAGLSREDLREIASSLGAMLGELQSLVWPSCAVYDPALRAIRSVELPFADWVIGCMTVQLSRCLTHSAATTDADVEWVGEVVARARPALALPFEPTFVHHDYKEGNATFERSGAGWRVSGVFDLMEGFFGDPEQDLARALSEYRTGERARRFLCAYAARRPLRPGFEERFRFYALADRVVIWEYGQRNRVWFPPEMSLRQFAEPFLEPPPA